jgi:hypothetical protein
MPDKGYIKEKKAMGEGSSWGSGFFKHITLSLPMPKNKLRQKVKSRDLLKISPREKPKVKRKDKLRG